MINMQMSATSFRLAESKIGDNNFLGNAISYPPNGRTGTNVLFGTKTMVPIDGPVRENVGLLGSPAFEIPRMVNRDRDIERVVRRADASRPAAPEERVQFRHGLDLPRQPVDDGVCRVRARPSRIRELRSFRHLRVLRSQLWRSPPPTWPSSSCSSARAWASSDSSRSSPRSTIRISGCTKGSGSYRLSRSWPCSPAPRSAACCFAPWA